MNRCYLLVMNDANNGGDSIYVLCSSHVVDDRQPLREYCREPPTVNSRTTLGSRTPV
jgi:hypothetical protein